MNSDPSLHQKRIETFERAVERFQADEMEPEEFKSIRLPLGVYYQLPETSWMTRLSIRGGRMNGETARYIAGRARRYENLLHLTTRQNVQLHQVDLEDIPGMLYDLLDLGVVTYGASGDGIRSIKLPARHGLNPDDRADLYSLLWKAEEYFAKQPYNMEFPRKFKITLAGPDASGVNLEGEDLGVRVVSFGNTLREHRFQVRAGGGLGARPQRACLLKEEIDGENLPWLMEAVVRYFNDHGDRDNRSQARLKFLLKDRGEETFREEILEYYDRLQREEEDLADQFFEPEPVPSEFVHQTNNPTDPSESTVDSQEDLTLLQQDDPDRRTIKLFTSLGDVLPEDLETLADWTEYHADDEIRIGADQNLYIPHVPVEQLSNVDTLRELKSLTLQKSGVVDIVCPGNDYCDLALTSSRSVSRRIEEFAQDHPNFAENLDDQYVNVSGCMNSCSWYQRADVGLHGHLAKEDGETVEVYSIHLGNGDGGFSTCVERGVPEGDVPERLNEILAEQSPA